MDASVSQALQALTQPIGAKRGRKVADESYEKKKRSRNNTDGRKEKKKHKSKHEKKAKDKKQKEKAYDEEAPTVSPIFQENDKFHPGYHSLWLWDAQTYSWVSLKSRARLALVSIWFSFRPKYISCRFDHRLPCRWRTHSGSMVSSVKLICPGKLRLIRILHIFHDQ